ncbi:MAG TPA: hypothetical protein VF789_28195 [Thermoanaerobaculia bacterium]
MAKEDDLRAIKKRHSAHLLQQEGVSGVGIEKDETGEPVLVVHLATDDAEIRRRLPDEIEGHRIVYRGSGPFRKLSNTN